MTKPNHLTDAIDSAVLRYVSGQDTKETFIANLRELGLYGTRVIEMIEHAEDQAFEIAAAAASHHFDRLLTGDRK